MDVFGYCLAVDPLVFDGTCVRKSNRNAAHDGTLIECPLDATHPGYVYQRVVNNEIHSGYVQDIRLTIMKQHIVLCLLSTRPISRRFEAFETEEIFANPDAVLTATESAQILCLCRHIGLDLGVLDVARDQDDGRIYVLDVNNTPSDPPIDVKGLERHDALRRISQAFDELFF